LQKTAYFLFPHIVLVSSAPLKKSNLCLFADVCMHADMHALFACSAVFNIC